ncbi:MAG: hypothetical protein U0354_19835 [Candidatus Sericytochromatia bacterium]
MVEENEDLNNEISYEENFKETLKDNLNKLRVSNDKEIQEYINQKKIKDKIKSEKTDINESVLHNVLFPKLMDNFNNNNRKGVNFEDIGIDILSILLKIKDIKSILLEQILKHLYKKQNLRNHNTLEDYTKEILVDIFSIINDYIFDTNGKLLELSKIIFNIKQNKDIIKNSLSPKQEIINFCDYSDIDLDGLILSTIRKPINLEHLTRAILSLSYLNQDLDKKVKKYKLSLKSIMNQTTNLSLNSDIFKNEACFEQATRKLIDNYSEIKKDYKSKKASDKNEVIINNFSSLLNKISDVYVLDKIIDYSNIDLDGLILSTINKSINLEHLTRAILALSYLNQDLDKKVKTYKSKKPANLKFLKQINKKSKEIDEIIEYETFFMKVSREVVKNYAQYKSTINSTSNKNKIIIDNFVLNMIKKEEEEKEKGTKTIGKEGKILEGLNEYHDRNEYLPKDINTIKFMEYFINNEYDIKTRYFDEYYKTNQKDDFYYEITKLIPSANKKDIKQIIRKSVNKTWDSNISNILNDTQLRDLNFCSHILSKIPFNSLDIHSQDSIIELNKLLNPTTYINEPSLQIQITDLEKLTKNHTNYTSYKGTSFDKGKSNDTTRKPVIHKANIFVLENILDGAFRRIKITHSTIKTSNGDIHDTLEDLISENQTSAEEAFLKDPNVIYSLILSKDALFDYGKGKTIEFALNKLFNYEYDNNSNQFINNPINEENAKVQKSRFLKENRDEAQLIISNRLKNNELYNHLYEFAFLNYGEINAQISPEYFYDIYKEIIELHVNILTDAYFSFKSNKEIIEFIITLVNIQFKPLKDKKLIKYFLYFLLNLTDLIKNINTKEFDLTKPNNFVLFINYYLLILFDIKSIDPVGKSQGFQKYIDNIYKGINSI